MAALGTGAGKYPGAVGSVWLPSTHVLVRSRSELGSRAQCLGQLQFTGPLGCGAESPDTLIYLFFWRPILAASARHRAPCGSPAQGCSTPAWHHCQRWRQAR